MALMEVNFFSKALMRPVTMNVILPVDKVFFGEETEEENKPFKTLYLLHGVMGNYTDWVTGTCIKRWAEEKNLAVVMPSGANMFYMDHPNANENYSEFIGKELVKTGLRHLREIKITINRRNAGFFMSNFIYFYVVWSCILSLYVI